MRLNNNIFFYKVNGERAAKNAIYTQQYKQCLSVPMLGDDATRECATTNSCDATKKTILGGRGCGWPFFWGGGHRGKRKIQAAGSAQAQHFFCIRTSARSPA